MTLSFFPYGKIFHFSSIKQAVFENAQEAENLPSLKILKACTTRWLTHGETSIRVINRFKLLVAALDALFKDKKDPEAKGIRDILLNSQIILMLLLLAEVLVPINNFYKFLQTRNLNYSLVMGKYQRVVSKLETIKKELPNHDSVDTTLKYFNLAKSYLEFSKESMSLSKELKSRDNEHSIDDTIIEFVRKTGESMITNLIAEVNDAMQETSPVLSAFDLFNPDVVFKDDKSRKEFFSTLTDHYGQPKTDRFENDTVTEIPIINSVQATIECDDFMEEFDSAVATLNENLKKNVKQLVTAKLIKSEEVESYIRSHKPT